MAVLNGKEAELVEAPEHVWRVSVLMRLTAMDTEHRAMEQARSIAAETAKTTAIETLARSPSTGQTVGRAVLTGLIQLIVVVAGAFLALHLKG